MEEEEIEEELKREGYDIILYRHYKLILKKGKIKKFRGGEGKKDEYNRMVEKIEEIKSRNKYKIEFRVNQEEAFRKIENMDDIETGIHCQATGCGKSYIIIKYCGNMIKSGRRNIIIFTERINILRDLFCLTDKINQREMFRIWKENNLIDMANVKIVDRITNKSNKSKNWMEEVDKEKSNIILINRAYITVTKETYNKIENGEIDLILHDECHNTVSRECYNFLRTMKEKAIKIVGFSATPLRTGKTNGEDNRERLMEIYGKEGKLNLITNYNMIYAISNKLILPPKFIWYNLSRVYAREYKEDENDSNDSKKTKKYEEENKYEKIEKIDIISVIRILKEVKTESKYNKIIAWCGTIGNTEKWYKKFKKLKVDEKDEYFKTIKIYKDHSKIKDTDSEYDDYNKFRERERDSIMFCANKHREGSDIRNLEICIFIDGVVNRSPIPFIQSIGRVLRIDREGKKENGYIIDCITDSEKNYETEVCEKIIGYYISLENTELVDIKKTRYDRYNEIKKNIILDKSRGQIKIKKEDMEIVIDMNKIEWKNIINKFDDMLIRRIEISIEEKMRSVAKILREEYKFNKNTDFREEYKKISKEERERYNLPEIENKEYLKMLNNNSWFDILGIEREYIEDREEAKRKIKEAGYRLDNAKKNWEIWFERVGGLPKYPHYYWRNFDINVFSEKKERSEF